MWRRFWIAALVILLFFPSSYGFYKYFFSAAVGLGVLVNISGRRPVSVATTLWAGMVLSVCLGIFLVAYDLLMFHDMSSLRFATFWVLAPFVYLLLMVLLSGDSRCTAILDSAIYWASLLISVNSLAFVVFDVLRIPYPLLFLDLDYGFGLDERGFLAFTTNNLPILAFTIPFMIANIGIAGNRTRFRGWTLAVSLLAAAASLRVAVLLNIVIAIGLLIVFTPSRKFRIRAAIAIGCGTVATALLFLLLPAVIESNPVLQGIYSVKLSQKFSGEDLRYKQLEVWLSAIAERPILGHGLSSTDITSSDLLGNIVEHHSGPVVNDYGKELTYFKTASEIGIVPIGLYAFGCLWILVRLTMVGVHGCDYEERNALSFGFGMACFLIASGTNGYLMTFGYVWTIFIPAIYLNHLVGRRASAADRPGLADRDIIG